MNRRDLDKILEAAPAPARPEEYWEEFPAKVVARLDLRREASVPERAASGGGMRIWGGLALGLAAACLVLGLVVELGQRKAAPAPEQRRADLRKFFGEVERLFPNQVRAVIIDNDGSHLLLAETADVPSSPALYVKACAAAGCEEVVTFSGQRVPFNGQSCEVLANAEGRVMLVGDHQVWSGEHSLEHVNIAGEPLLD